MQKVDVTKVKPEELADIRDVIVDKRQKQEQWVQSFVKQIKNPYCYKYGDYIVKINFADTSVTITEQLRELIFKAANIK